MRAKGRRAGYTAARFPIARISLVGHNAVGAPASTGLVGPVVASSPSSGRGSSRPTGDVATDCGREDVALEVHHVNGDPGRQQNPEHDPAVPGLPSQGDLSRHLSG